MMRLVELLASKDSFLLRRTVDTASYLQGIFVECIAIIATIIFVYIVVATSVLYVA